MSTLIKVEEYLPRLIDDTIEEYLKSCGAICIEGPKWCGKTWTSAFHSNSHFLVGSSDNGFYNREFAKISPSSTLKGDTPRLIDEWQEVPSLWDAVRAEVDVRNEYGLIILTGSSTPTIKGVMHSGIGRIACIRMDTMTLFESNDSTGSVSLAKLVKGEVEPHFTKELSLENIAKLIVRGGWPKNINALNPSIMPKSYVERIINGTLTDEEKKNFPSSKVEKILKSLARNESTTASISRIAKDIEEIDKVSISPDTVTRYLDIFNRMFLFNNQLPFDTNVRSSIRVKGMVKRHFCDPSLACSILDLNEKKLLNDLNTFGLLFESLVERDLNVYAKSNNAKLYHYQNYSDEEIDAVIELDDGNWCAFEIKLSANRIDEGATNLNKVCKHIVESGGKAPIVKAVICGLGNAFYKRNDDVYVIPIGCLRN